MSLDCCGLSQLPARSPLGDAPASPFPQRQRVTHRLFVGRSKARFCLSVETLILQDLTCTSAGYKYLMYGQGFSTL